MLKLLVCGLPKSGTTAVYYALQQSYPQARRISFLEPAPAIRERFHALPEDVADVEITKILIDGKEQQGNLLKRADRIVLLLRDPRDIIVSWLPFHFASRAIYTLNDELMTKLTTAFQRKADCFESVSISDIQNIYADFDIKVYRPDSYGPLLSAYHDIASQYSAKTTIVAFSEIYMGLVTLEAALGRPVKRRNLRGDISVNQRSGLSGDWKNWFTRRDIGSFWPVLHDFIETHGFDAWDLPAHPRFDASSILRYMKDARRSRKRLVAAAKNAGSAANGKPAKLFGDVKPEPFYTRAALTRLRDFAGHGNIEAMREYALLSERGIAVKREPARARRLLRICVALGDANAAAPAR